MKTLLTILLCLWPLGVRGQHHVNITGLPVALARQGPGDVFADYSTPDSCVFFTIGQVRRMIDSTVAARIAELGRWEMVIHEPAGKAIFPNAKFNWAPPETTWVFVRPEEKP